jgi:hypothetical protein
MPEWDQLTRALGEAETSAASAQVSGEREGPFEQELRWSSEKPPMLQRRQ